MSVAFTHTLIKIKYINEGYLENHPYRMISDAEMFNAFTKENGYFADTYPCVNADLTEQYEELKEFIFGAIKLYQDYSADVPQRVRNAFPEGFLLPDWIYSYMLGYTLSVQSSEQDIEYLYGLLNLENEEPVFDADLSEECYKVSVDWIKKLPAKFIDRPATVFGEPHVIKSLRLQTVDVLN